MPKIRIENLNANSSGELTETEMDRITGGSAAVGRDILIGGTGRDVQIGSSNGGVWKTTNFLTY